jgi:hypothetical protein
MFKTLSAQKCNWRRQQNKLRCGTSAGQGARKNVRRDHWAEAGTGVNK